MKSSQFVTTKDVGDLTQSFNAKEVCGWSFAYKSFQSQIENFLSETWWKYFGFQCQSKSD